MPFLDVAFTPWSEWGNCDKCDNLGNRKRVRTCNWPAAPAGGSTVTTCAGYIAQSTVNGVLTDTETDTTTCTGIVGPIAGTPYTDTCNIGEYFKLNCVLKKIFTSYVQMNNFLKLINNPFNSEERNHQLTYCCSKKYFLFQLLLLLGRNSLWRLLFP